MPLRPALEERKARTRSVKMFNGTAKELESRITDNLSNEDVDQAREVMLKAFNDMLVVHQAYQMAKQGSESEDLSDDSEDMQWLEKPKQTKADALAKYSEWKKGKADEEIKAAEEREERKRSRERKEALQGLQARMEAKILCSGNPENDVQEFLARNVTVGGTKLLVQELKDKLAQIEQHKEIVVTSDPGREDY